MSDRLNKASLSVGASWHLFAENIAFEESDNNIRRGANMSETARLHSQDSSLFGRCPARSYLQLITCKLCQKVIVAPALHKHYELKHDKHLGTIKVSPPKKTMPSKRTRVPGHSSVSFSKSKVLKAGNGKQVIRIEEVDPNDTSVKIEEVPLPLPTLSSTTSKSHRKINIKPFDFKNVTIQDERVLSPSSTLSSQSTSKNSKKVSHSKEKEYDPEKHCGVWMPDIQRNCTRSITCKAHSLSLRRNVTGRSKDFDVLLAEHRTSKINLKSNENLISSPPTPLQSSYSHERINSSMSSISSGANYRKDSSSSKPFKSLSPAAALASPDAFRSPPIILTCISDDVRNVTSLPSIQRHPRPITTNKFGIRQTECKCRTFSRKMDHFRNASTAMLNRYKNLHQSRATLLQDSTKNETEGIFAAMQDPLQNGFIHKQLNSLKPNKILQNTGSKRHLSLNDLQNPSFNISGITKRRHSTIIDNASVSPNQYLNRSISNPAEAFEKLSKVNEFLKPSSEATNLILRRSKSVNAFTNSSFEITSSPGYVLQPQKGLSTTPHQTNSVILSPTKQTIGDSKKLSPAPNITITQGMIVSLPPTLFQQTSTFSMNPHSKDVSIVTCTTPILPSSSPSIISSTKQSKQSVQKQQREQENSITQALLSQANGICPSMQTTPTTPVMKSQDFVSKISLSDGRLAPNVTVTASHSLSGVLHAVTVCGANVRLKSPPPSFKGVNSRLNDHRAQLIQQQLIMQAQQLSRDHVEKVNLISPSSQQPQTLPQLQQQQASYTTLPIEQGTRAANSVQNNPQQQQHRKLQTQQQGVAQQLQLQNQHFISLHGGYQQQILPKLPSVPQVVPQFHNQQFTPTQNQRNVQYIAQGSSANALPQQHGGTLT